MRSRACLFVALTSLAASAQTAGQPEVHKKPAVKVLPGVEKGGPAIVKRAEERVPSPAEEEGRAKTSKQVRPPAKAQRKAKPVGPIKKGKIGIAAHAQHP